MCLHLERAANFPPSFPNIPRGRLVSVKPTTTEVGLAPSCSTVHVRASKMRQKPTQPTQPGARSQPTQPTQPGAEPANPARSQPSRPSQPSQEPGANPADPADPANPANPANRARNLNPFSTPDFQIRLDLSRTKKSSPFSDAPSTTLNLTRTCFQFPVVLGGGLFGVRHTGDVFLGFRLTEVLHVQAGLGPTAVNSTTALLYASLATPTTSLPLVWIALSKAVNPKKSRAVWRTPKSPPRKLEACVLSWT